MVLRRKTLLLKTLPFLLVGLAIYIIYLIFFVNTGEMLATLASTNLGIFPIAIVATTLEMVFFALAWLYYLKPLSATSSFKKMVAYSWVSNFIDILVPAESISGEISRIYFVTRDGVEPGKAVASVVSQRISAMLILVGALTVGVLQLSALHAAFPTLVQNTILLVVVATTVMLALIFVLCLRESWTQKAVNKVICLGEYICRGRWNLEPWKCRAVKATKAFYESLRTFKEKPLSLIPPALLSVLSFFSGLLVYYTVFAALGYMLDWVVLITVYCLVMALKSIPVGVPAELGVTEIAMTSLFGAFGVPLQLSGAATILIRLVTVWFRFGIGFGAVQWVGLKSVLETQTFKT